MMLMSPQYWQEVLNLLVKVEVSGSTQANAFQVNPGVCGEDAICPLLQKF